MHAHSSRLAGALLALAIIHCPGAAQAQAVQDPNGDAQSPSPGAAAEAATALSLLAPALPSLGLDDRNRLEVVAVARDGNGVSHVRLQQRFRGLKVWGGQAVVHLKPLTGPAALAGPITNALVPDLQLEVSPNLQPGEALAVAQARVAPQGTYARPPTAELLVYPETMLRPEVAEAENAEDFQVELVRNHLAYHLHLELENGAPETRHEDLLVDAHTGAVLKAWSSLFTAKANKAVFTTGHSQYSGPVQLGSQTVACGYTLLDPTRKNLATRNLGGHTGGKGVLFTSPAPEWGDGQNYRPEQGPKSANGQTAAVDAHYGLQTTWDFYHNILGRDGIDGTGRSTYNLVHYDHAYDNAFWSNECFCMTYGDGDTFNTLTAIDVVGHEVSHGLCHTTADLGYLGETGGLNEANSDIFGAMISFYAKGAEGKGAAIPERGGRWTVGFDLQTSAYPHPLRYLYKPSLDGFSPDAWSRDLDFLDVHYSSGPMNRAFYFLSQGASAKAGEDTYSSYLPKGMAGVGNDRALRIWWRTLQTYLTPGSRYVDARKGALRASEDLYGKGSPESWAVRRAFKAINVGEKEPGRRRSARTTRSTRSRDQGVDDMDTSS